MKILGSKRVYNVAELIDALNNMVECAHLFNADNHKNGGQQIDAGLINVLDRGEGLVNIQLRENELSDGSTTYDILM